MKERKIILYNNYIEGLDKINYSSSFINSYKIIVEEIKKLECVLEIPKPLSPKEFQELFNTYLIEDVIKKLKEMDEYMHNVNKKTNHYLSLYITLDMWLKRYKIFNSIDRDKLELQKEVNKKNNYKRYKFQRNMIKSKLNLPYEEKDLIIMKKYLKLINLIRKKKQNLYAASSIITFEEFNILSRHFKINSLIKSILMLDKFEFIIQSSTSIESLLEEMHHELPLKVDI